MAGVVCVSPKITAPTPRASNVIAPTSAQKNKQEQEQATRNQDISITAPVQHTGQQQSMAMVQIVLHASIGTLFYLRQVQEFLPLSCFGERDLLALSAHSGNVSYEDFIDGKTSANNTKGHVKRGQPLKIILKNRNEKADVLLDLLERGVFEALSKNILEAVQLTVFVDKDHPTNVLESYTFSFKYTGDVRDVNSRLASISLESGYTADMKTLRTAKHGLETIIRRLITLSTFLPLLPNKRYMEIHLFYTEDCPADYEPPGFRMAAHDPLVFPNSEDWTRETQSCGSMDSGFHSVGLKVTSLKWRGNDHTESPSRAQIPEDIRYSELVARDHDVGFDNINDVVMISQSCSQESTGGSNEAEGGVSKKTLTFPTWDSDLVPTQANPESMAMLNSIARPQISQVKVSAIRNERQRSLNVDLIHGKQNQGELAADGGGIVSCQCGLNNLNEDMVQCVFCNTRQHLICYGFLYAQDPSIPEPHACYKCLLEPRETTLLREMDTLVLLRRALRVIIEEGYPNHVRDFAQKLGCNGNTIVQITDMLRRRGFLQATPGSKSKGFLSKGLPKFTVPDSPEIRDKLKKEIFNPLSKISHHYIVPDDWQANNSGKLDDYLQASQSHCGSKKVVWQSRQSTECSFQEAGSYTSFSNSSVRLTHVMDADAGTNPQTIVDTQDTPFSSRRRRERNLDDEPQETEIPESQRSRNAGIERETRLRKKRKLSNVTRPIDICDPIDEESS
ncbi:hypothetical protein VTO42DRAFT_7459 [Malbranchea cinnamomea]